MVFIGGSPYWRPNGRIKGTSVPFPSHSYHRTAHPRCSLASSVDSELTRLSGSSGNSADLLACTGIRPAPDGVAASRDVRQPIKERLQGTERRDHAILFVKQILSQKKHSETLPHIGPSLPPAMKGRPQLVDKYGEIFVYSRAVLSASSAPPFIFPANPSLPAGLTESRKHCIGTRQIRTGRWLGSGVRPPHPDLYSHRICSHFAAGEHSSLRRASRPGRAYGEIRTRPSRYGRERHRQEGRSLAALRVIVASLPAPSRRFASASFGIYVRCVFTPESRTEAGQTYGTTLQAYSPYRIGRAHHQSVCLTNGSGSSVGALEHSDN